MEPRRNGHPGLWAQKVLHLSVKDQLQIWNTVYQRWAAQGLQKLLLMYKLRSEAHLVHCYHCWLECLKIKGERVAILLN
jgi:hypothetical protein